MSFNSTQWFALLNMPYMLIVSHWSRSSSLLISLTNGAMNELSGTMYTNLIGPVHTWSLQEETWYVVQPTHHWLDILTGMAAPFVLWPKVGIAAKHTNFSVLMLHDAELVWSNQQPKTIPIMYTQLVGWWSFMSWYRQSTSRISKAGWKLYFTSGRCY
jgi:hypothetical protein